MIVSTEQLFTDARTHNGYFDDAVSDEMLHALYDLLKWGPTSANSCPARFVFVRSAAAKARLLECMSPGNQLKVREAPVTVIVIFEAFGLNENIKDISRRFAEAGYVALAPDLYYPEQERVVAYSDMPKVFALANTLPDTLPQPLRHAQQVGQAPSGGYSMGRGALQQ